jgi:hypothetical protein
MLCRFVGMILGKQTGEISESSSNAMDGKLTFEIVVAAIDFHERPRVNLIGCRIQA